MDNIEFDNILQEELEKDGINKQAILACRMEKEITGETLAEALVRNGFIKQEAVVNTILKINPDGLVSEDVYAPHVPAKLLEDKKILISAITEETVYIATGISEMEAKEYIKPYFIGQEIKFIPFDKIKFEEYIEKINNISNQQNSENLDGMLRKAILEKVSDIHITPNYNTYSISRRFLGVKYIDKIGSIEEYLPLAAQIKDRAQMDIAETRLPQDGAFSIEINNRMVDLRVATVPAQNGETIVIRILDPENAQTNLDSVGITKIDEWRKGASRSNGLCLICGPTGSGKTTTLNSTMKELDRFGKAIFSVEDPVEYKLPYITQVSANPQLGLDFKDAVKAFMRSDPDIIIVGEVRDMNTAQNMMKAAETGHLVFATLHTETIRGTITRLKDIGVDVTELKYMLRAVLVQNLVRVPCKECWGKGCDYCGDKGYTGRTVVSECKYFKDQKAVEMLLDENVDINWDSIIEDSYLKLREGKTNYDELFRVYGEEAVEILRSRISEDYQDVKNEKITEEFFLNIYGKMGEDYLISINGENNE